MLEEQAPNHVEPADDDTAGDGEDGHDQRNQALLLEEVAPTDKQLDDPVDEGNQKEEDLNQSAAAVKPLFH